MNFKKFSFIFLAILSVGMVVLLIGAPKQAEAAATEAEFVRIKVDSTSSFCGIPGGNCSQLWNMFYTNDGTVDEFNVTATDSSTAGYVCGMLLTEEFTLLDDHDMILWAKKGVVLGKNGSLSADMRPFDISCCDNNGGTDCDMDSGGNCKADVITDANYVYQKSYGAVDENKCATDNWGAPCNSNAATCCKLADIPFYSFFYESLCNNSGKWAVCDDENACATDGTNDYACNTYVTYTEWENCTAQGKVCNSGTCVAQCDVKPTLTISPDPQQGKAGNTLTYTITVKNNDKNTCPNRTFNLSETQEAWAGTGTINAPVSLVLAGQASGSTTYTLTSPGGATAGNYVFKIKATDAADATLFDEKDGTYAITTCLSGDNMFVEFSPDSYVTGDILKVAYGIIATVATNDYRICVYNPAGNNISWTTNTSRELFTHFAGSGDVWSGSTGITSTLGTWVVSLEQNVSCPGAPVSACRGSAVVTAGSGGGGGGGGGGTPPCGWINSGSASCKDCDGDTFLDDLEETCGPAGCAGGVCVAGATQCVKFDDPTCLTPCQLVDTGNCCTAASVCGAINAGQRCFNCQGSGGNPSCAGGSCSPPLSTCKADKQCLYASLGCMCAGCPGGECPPTCGIAGCCVEETCGPADPDCSEVVYGVNNVLNNFDPNQAQVALNLANNEVAYIVLPVGANITSADGNPTNMGTDYDGDTTDFAIVFGTGPGAILIPTDPKAGFTDFACPLESILKNCSCDGCQFTTNVQWGIDYCKVPITGNKISGTLTLSLQAPNYFIKYEMPQLPIFPGGLVPCGRHTDDPLTNLDESANCSLCHTLVLTKKGIDFGLTAIVLPLIGTLIIAGGGFLIFAGGSPKNIATGKTILLTTAKGAALALGGWLLIETVIAGLVPSSAPWRDWEEVVCDVAPCDIDGDCNSIAVLTADGNHITKGTGEDSQSCPSDCACNIAQGAGCGGPLKKECNFDGNCDVNEAAGMPEPCPDCTACGNGTKEIGEECDGNDFGVILNDKIIKAGGQKLCLLIAGYNNGNFSCAGCKLNTDSCEQK